jgi:hypothetical protein
MEEITLSVPRTLPDRQEAPARNETGSPQAPVELERLARGFLAAARSRDRPALTDRHRRQRQENFELRLKGLIKPVASETADLIADRRCRIEVRTRIYAAMMVMARVSAQDQVRTVRRCRRALRWAFASGAVGTAGMFFTVMAKGWI